MQRTPAAWGLIVPLLAHEDANVQFFGAHTAHAKIARGELASLPETEQIALRDALVGLAGVQGRSRVVRRKLYGALTALALRLVPPPGPGRQSAWEGWVEGTVASLAGAGAPSEHIHEFLAGAAEDVGAANLLPQHRIQLDESLRSAAPLVLQSVSAVLSNPSSNDASLPAALTCLIAWLPNKLLPDMEVARLVPPLISLLGSSNSTGDDNDTGTEAARQALSELLARPPAGWSPAVLLEPLLLWAVTTFPEYAPPPPGSSQLSTTFPNSGYPTPPSSQQSSFAGPSSATSSPYADLLSPNYALPPALLHPCAEAKTKNAHKAPRRTRRGGRGVGRGARRRLHHRFPFARFARDSTGGPGPDPPQARAGADGGGSRRGESAPRFCVWGYEVQNESGDGGEGEEDDEDEEAEGGAPLGFWYLLQEALWEIPVSIFLAAFWIIHGGAVDFYSPFLSLALLPDWDCNGMRIYRCTMGLGRRARFDTSQTPTSSPPPPGISSPMISPGGGMDPDDPDRFRRGSPWTPASPTCLLPLHLIRLPRVVLRHGASARRVFLLVPGLAVAVWGQRTGPRGRSEKRPSEAEKARTAHARAARCVEGEGGGRDRLERFGVYRRDVGDTVVNAYYILRDDLLVYLVGEAAAGLESGARWETIESPLFLLRAVHEALDLDSTSTSTTPSTEQSVGMMALGRLFGAEVWGAVAECCEGWGQRGGAGGSEAEADGVGAYTYSAYFTTRGPDAVLAPLQYVLGALQDQDAGICLQAALALRSLCDANRRALAARISAFAEVHAGLGGVPDSEKGKVLQSIASVIQALPPAEGIAPVEAMVGPILQRLGAALGAVGAHPDAARLAAILQIEILAGVARGLTRTADPMSFDEDEEGGAEAEAVRAAREDPRTGALRSALFDAIAQVAELWSADAEVGQALSELFKAITALPADVTLLSLPAAPPLLGVVCRAAGRRLTGVWLALATILIAQLNPPPLLLTPLKSGPSEEAEECVRQAVGGLVGAALGVLGSPNGMVENPDIVQEFFACMDRVAQDFTAAFCALPDGAFDALMQCAISALSLQERYSLVAACTFLGTLIHRTALYAPISELLQHLQSHMIRTHGRSIMRAVLWGFAGAAPRSVTANLLELLGALRRWGDRARGGRGSGARGWVAGVVFADDFFPSKAGQGEKERFVKTVVSSRSVKKTKEAANQFTIVAWGLEGSTFGYSSVSS
ncbi:hypothetical protein MVEN_01689300 [Mycena venus]|uniref:ARM repeat-containing protein n=1 Tax=Mycena venus TaxID=2733690 RepID=A0A8H6XPI0_9AGAR|nr:hypothetical protein MVEN_01689300 [Mycena venus]